MGSRQDRQRAWFLTDYGAVLAGSGDVAGAADLFEQAIRLKEQLLGPEHPDVAITLVNLALARTRLGQLEEAQNAANRARDICVKIGDPDASFFVNLHANRGDVLLGLGRYSEGGAEFETALKTIHHELGSDYESLSQALNGLGEVRLAQRSVTSAIPLLEQALAIREAHPADMSLIADTRFALARALWEEGAHRRRARSLARKARDTYASSNRPQNERVAAAWLTAHTMAGQ
jgi:tetratricopeptide (TPR) repeat protein